MPLLLHARTVALSGPGIDGAGVLGVGDGAGLIGVGEGVRVATPVDELGLGVTTDVPAQPLSKAIARRTPTCLNNVFISTKGIQAPRYK